MKTKSFLLLMPLLLFAINSCGVVEKGDNGAKKPLNIIIFIGDGMGPAEVSAGIAVSDNTLVVEKLPYSGFCKTYSYDNYVTDSAAGGTAIATGVKTRNGMIGMGPDTTIVTTIMEIAHKNGLSTGLVSTSAITHATPASFVAHNSGRGNYEDIALDYMNGIIDVFIGGGSDHFNMRKDGKDLTSELKKQGYDVVFSLGELQESGSSRIAGLLAKQHMNQANMGRKGVLADMTQKAIDVLGRNKKGFILMVEGSQIDFAGHANDIGWLTSEVIDFDNAVGIAYEYAQQSGNTLLVVTADHETGGLTLPGGSLTDRTIEPNFGGKGHTAVLVPIFSYGPGAERFSGIHDNTFFFNEFTNLLGLQK